LKWTYAILIQASYRYYLAPNPVDVVNSFSNENYLQYKNFNLAYFII